MGDGCGNGGSEVGVETKWAKFKARGSDIIVSVLGALIMAGMGVGFTMIYTTLEWHSSNTAHSASALITGIEKLTAEQRQSNRYACEQVCILGVTAERRETVAAQCRAACVRN